MKYKQSAVDLSDLAIGVLILGVVVTVGALVLTNVRDARLTDLPTYATSSEIFSGSNTTAATLTNTYFKQVDSVYNDTTLLTSANYTVTTDTVTGKGSVLMTTGDYNGFNLTANYTSYNTTNSDWSIADDAATGIAEYGNWFKIIVIVGVAAVVLSLIFMAFGGSKSSAY